MGTKINIVNFLGDLNVMHERITEFESYLRYRVDEFCDEEVGSFYTTEAIAEKLANVVSNLPRIAECIDEVRQELDEIRVEIKDNEK